MEATVPAGDNEENTIPVVEETSLYHDLVNSTGQAETHSHEQNQPGIMSDKVLQLHLQFFQYGFRTD